MPHNHLNTISEKLQQKTTPFEYNSMKTDNAIQHCIDIYKKNIKINIIFYFIFQPGCF